MGDAVAPGSVTRGRFIVFEGGEASGKSTQAARLARRLGAVATREPGGTELGERLRRMLLDPATGDLDARTELLLMAAARAEHVARVIEPALVAGNDVVSDRFQASSIAYQAFGRGLDPGEVERISAWATAGLEPDVTVLLEVDDDTRAARLGEDRDRLESAGDAFHVRVAEGFRALAAADSRRWIVLDGAAPVDQVAAAVFAAVNERLS